MSIGRLDTLAWRFQGRIENLSGYGVQERSCRSTQGIHPEAIWSRLSPSWDVTSLGIISFYWANQYSSTVAGYKWLCVTNLLDTINIKCSMWCNQKSCTSITRLYTTAHSHGLLESSTLIFDYCIYIHMIYMYFFIDLELTFTQTLSCPWSGQTVDIAIKEGGRACVVSQQNKVLFHSTAAGHCVILLCSRQKLWV